MIDEILGEVALVDTPLVHAPMADQLTEFVVPLRPVILFAAVEKIAELPVASPSMVTFTVLAASLPFAVNCKVALVILAPRGIASPVKRNPTVFCAEPIYATSSVLPVVVTVPPVSSASLALALTRGVNVVVPQELSIFVSLTPPK